MDDFVRTYLMKDYLSHHGIKGQKWGERNGPPYPLSNSARSSSEKKFLDKRKRKSNTNLKVGGSTDSNEKNRATKINLNKSGSFSSLVGKGKEVVDKLLGKGKTNSARNISQWKIDDLQRLSGMPKTDQTVQAGNEFKKIAEPESLNETLKKVNPNREDSKYKYNCTACSVASFLRTIGFDVTAKDTGGKTKDLYEVVKKCFNNVEPKEWGSVKFGRSRQDATDMIVKYFGNNASGVLSVPLINGTSHAFNWEIKDGVVKFFDGQDMNNNERIDTIWKIIDTRSNRLVKIARLDNAEINFEGIKDFVKNRI